MFSSLQTELLPKVPQDSPQDHGFFLDPHPSKRKRNRISVPHDDIEENIDCKLRKIMHRDIERHRRQEMAELYSSLRSLLPAEYVRGKRSISDHMNEAVKYIKTTEKSIQELCIRRDKLKRKLRDSSVSENGSISSNLRKDPSSFCVNVSACDEDDIEILISCDLRKGEVFPLSGILMELINIGLNVIHSISTRADHLLIHRIQSKVEDVGFIDLASVQRRLEDVFTFGGL